MEAKDNKRYFIGVMIPAKTFFDNLDALCMLTTEHNLGDVVFNTRTRMTATKRVVIQYINANCALEKLRGRHFDAVFHFDDRYREVLDYRTTEIRDDNYLDYILEKEGAVNLKHCCACNNKRKRQGRPQHRVKAYIRAIKNRRR